jgi:hypothetical protein
VFSGEVAIELQRTLACGWLDLCDETTPHENAGR